MENKSPIQTSNQEIVQLLRDRDKEAIRLIYKLYGNTLLGVIARIVKNKEVAEDVFQDSVIKIWKNGPNYDSSKGRLFTWMLNICRNRAIDILRSKEYKKNLKIQGDENFVINTAEQQTYSFNPDTIGIKEKLEKLEPEYLQAIYIVYYGGFTHKEASEKLKIPLGTLKSRIRIAIRELRKTLVDER